MIYDKWLGNVIDKKLPLNEEFRIEKLLTNDVEMSKWASNGLPGDELSIQNGILTTRASRWPLCIDPQMQAVQWIKEKEQANSLDILSFNEHNFMKKLQNAIQFGHSVLFEAIDIEIDPMVDPLLEKNITINAGIKYIKLSGD